MIVLFCSSSATAPEAEKIAMNKLVRNNVDSPNSRRSLLSSLIVYIVKDGVTKNNISAATIIMAKMGCLSVSMNVFLAIVNSLFIRYDRSIAPDASAEPA
jgi:hypothetical protein